MKRYPAYKQEHRLPGIQEVPEHWGVVRNSLIFKEVSETGYGHLDLLSILSYKGIVKQSETGRKERAPEDRSSYKRIQKGDIGYNLMNAFMGSIGASNYEGIISPAYAVCRPKIEIDPNYFHYLFRTNLYLTEFDRNAYGIMYERNRLYFDNFKRIYVPFPPLYEQKAIAHFIDRKLEEIDHFIRNKQRLIELLNEQKTAIINRAVTKGINPNAPMKNSGIEWLGEIPQHWNIAKIGYVCSVTSGGTPDRSRPEYWNGEIPWIKTGEINFNEIHKAEEYITEEGLINSSAKVMPPGTLLMAMYGQGVTRGRVAILAIEAAFNQACLAMCPSNNLNINYLFYFFMASYQFIRDTGNETSQMNLSAGLIKTVKVLLPPLEEQTKIVAYLNKENIQIDLAIAKAEKEIELIQEYRTTLISDAVTGKIDVSQNPALKTTLTA